MIRGAENLFDISADLHLSEMYIVSLKEHKEYKINKAYCYDGTDQLIAACKQHQQSVSDHKQQYLTHGLISKLHLFLGIPFCHDKAEIVYEHGYDHPHGLRKQRYKWSCQKFQGYSC